MQGSFGVLWSLLKYGLISTISVALAFALVVHFTPQLGRQANVIRRLGRAVSGPLTSDEYKLERLPPGVISPEIQEILEKHNIEDEEELARHYDRLGLSSVDFIALGPTERLVYHYCSMWRSEAVRKEWHDRSLLKTRTKIPNVGRLFDDLTQYLRLHCK